MVLQVQLCSALKGKSLADKCFRCRPTLGLVAFHDTEFKLLAAESCALSIKTAQIRRQMELHLGSKQIACSTAEGVR